jgi:hypothetical protein
MEFGIIFTTVVMSFDCSIIITHMAGHALESECNSSPLSKKDELGV